jgi:hypothetical protein
VAKLEHYKSFTLSKLIILNLASTLVECFSHLQLFYVLYLNNFFTTCKLYQELYERGIRANSTAKAGAGILKELAYL